MSDERKSIKDRLRQLTTVLAKFSKYSLAAFLVFVALIYSYLMLSINTLSSAEPSEAAVTEQVKAAKVPHIDEKVVKQLETLEDNSVSVKALFNEARNNPF